MIDNEVRVILLVLLAIAILFVIVNIEEDLAEIAKKEGGNSSNEESPPSDGTGWRR